MRFKELDTVVLNRDLPEHGLRRGDHGCGNPNLMEECVQEEQIVAGSESQQRGSVRDDEHQPTRRSALISAWSSSAG